LEADEVRALFYRDLSKFNRFFNISFFRFTTGYLDTCQFYQRFFSPWRIEILGNANKVKMKCQGLIEFGY